MFLSKTIKGKYIDISSVTESDAEFIIALRSDEDKTKFLHKIDTNLSKQKEWIKEQIARDNDFYFVYSNKSGERRGLASIYNIDENNKSAEFGRWISIGNVFENLESVILIFDFAFENFDIDTICLNMVKGNDYVTNFWKTFGAKNIGLVFESDLCIDKWIVTKTEYYSSIRLKQTKLLRY